MQQLILKTKELPYDVEEEIKSLRTNIQLCGDDKRVILFTSCLANEGKSTTVRQISFSLAELGKKVLLIDTDLRKSTVKNNVQTGQIKAGLTHYLVGQSTMEQIIYQTQNEKMHIIPAGALPPNPSELLSSQRMGELMKKAREEYDYVIVDAAPLGLVTDAAIVAQKCDGAILLIESGVVKYRLAQEVLQKLNSTKCPVLGAVLNKVDRSADHYYSYAKNYSERYQEYRK